MNTNIDLFQIIRRDTFQEFKNMFKKSDINILDEDNKNMLMVAILHDKYDIAELLILNGIDLNHQDKEGNTSLHFVAKSYTDIKYAELLINNKCKINIENRYGNEPLWDAVFNSWKAINYGKNNLVAYLVKNGANSNHENNFKKSPLSIIDKFYNEDLFKILDKNSSMNKSPNLHLI